MPDSRPQYKPNEEKALNKLMEICDKSIRHTAQQSEKCMFMRTHLMRAWDQKQAEIRELAHLNEFDRKLDSITYISSRINLMQTKGILLSNALQLASGEYDNILKTRAAKPISGEIAFTLALTLLPELKVVGHAMNYFTEGRGAMNKFRMLAKIVDYTDNQAKDMLEGMMNPMGVSAEVAAESKLALKAFNAKNQIVKGIVKSIEKRLVMLQRVEQACFKLALADKFGDETRDAIEEEFVNSGLGDTGPYEGISFDLYSDLVLYDMLRSYVSQYCVVGVSLPTRDSGPLTIAQFNDAVGEVDGLDSAQRSMVFKKFGAREWTPRSHYGTVDTVWDLVDRLGARAGWGHAVFPGTHKPVFPQDIEKLRLRIRKGDPKYMVSRPVHWPF